MKNRSKQQIALTILKVVGAAGILSTALIAPNSLKMLNLFGMSKRQFSNKKHYVKTTISRLKSRKLIVLVEKRNKKYFKLTDKGRAELIKKQKIEIKKPKKWDGKWRMVIFDIKEKNKNSRDQLRNCLKNIGFKKVQNSVWVYPYKCEELIFLLKTGYSLGKSVLYMEVSHLENDKWIKSSFKL